MRVGIVGAGICGLAAARTLKAGGHEPVVFEKNRRVGGRVSTFTKSGYVWDTGATSVAPRGKAIEQLLLDELDASHLVRITRPIYLHSGLRVSPGASKGGERYTYTTGLSTLPKMLAENLDIRLDSQVDAVEKAGDGYRLLGDEFDALILTPPTPRASALLWSLEESRPLANVFYRCCINVALGYELPSPQTSYFALLEHEQRHPLGWLSLESVKSPCRAPDGCSAFCAQFSPRFSLDSYAQSDESLVTTAAFFLSRLYGPNYAKPATHSVKRWKYSQPDSVSSIDEANPPGTRVLIAGDALLGGHIEDAYEVGVRVAQRLVNLEID